MPLRGPLPDSGPAPAGGFDQQILFKASQEHRVLLLPYTGHREVRAAPSSRSPRAGGTTAATRATSTSSSSAPPTAAAPGARSRWSTRATATPTATRRPSWTAAPAGSCSPRRTTRAATTARAATCPATAPRTSSTATTTAPPGPRPRDLSREHPSPAVELLVRHRARARHPAHPRAARRPAGLRRQLRELRRQPGHRQPRRPGLQRRRRRHWKIGAVDSWPDRRRRHVPSEALGDDPPGALRRLGLRQRARTGRHRPRPPHRGGQPGRRRLLRRAVPRPPRPLHPDGAGLGPAPAHPARRPRPDAVRGARRPRPAPDHDDPLLLGRGPHLGGRRPRRTVVTTDWSGYSDLVAVATGDVAA